MPYLQTLDSIVLSTIAPAAQATDRDAAFPRAAGAMVDRTMESSVCR